MSFCEKNRLTAREVCAATGECDRQGPACDSTETLKQVRLAMFS